MVKRLFFTLCLLLIASSAVAQNDEDDNIPPDYQVTIFRYDLTSDEREIIISYAVYNRGGPAESEGTVTLTDLSTGDVLARTDIRPLSGSGDSVTEERLRFPVARFDPGSNPQVEVMATVQEEPDDTTLDNADSIGVQIPLFNEPASQDAPEPAADENADEPLPSDAAEPNTDNRLIPETITVPGLDVVIDTTDSEQMTLLAGIVATALLLLVLLVMILRLLFRRKPTFGTFQPPYATMPPLDPDSTFGRRQSWQQHAQNNVVPVPCKNGTIYPRKLLLGMDGRYLDGWKVTAMRMTQYDMYGRVSRSEVLAPRQVVRRIDRLARKSGTLDRDRLARRVRPAARAMARRIRRRINKRSALLPIALDLRFLGTHGEVRILFELYDCEHGQPVQLDYWEPEMTVLGKRIHESYTYTVHGQTGGETYRQFLKRIAEDVEHVLVEMLYTPPPAAPAQPEPAAAPETLAGGTQPMQPVDVAPAAGATSNTDELPSPPQESPQPAPTPASTPTPGDEAEDDSTLRGVS